MNLLENAHKVIVYHGDEKENAPLHPKMFFSSDRGVAGDYGKYISTYELDVDNFADTLDPELIKQFLPLHDPYDEQNIATMSDYMDRSSDTWEMIEQVADTIVHMFDLDGLIIYEGGCRNYMVYNTNCLRPVLNRITENMRTTYFGGFEHPPTRTIAIKYLTGWCPYFALAVHDLYGGQIIFNGQHFGVQFGDKFVDSRGISAADEWTNITPMSREEMVEEIESGHYKCGYFDERELAKAKRLVKSLKLSL